MGYDAFVPCNCWRDGRAASPPCPVVWDEADGMYVPEPALDTDEAFWQVAAWQRTACLHRNMKVADEHLGNLSALSELRAAIATIGRERLPTLARILPTFNGGHVPVRESADVLRDLDHFEAQVSGLPTLVLSWGNPEQERYSIFPGEELVFAFSPGGSLGLDDQGFFVRQNEQIVFRGTRVRQQMQPGGRLARFENLDTGGAIENAPSFSGGELSAPSLLLVAPSRVQPSEYARIVGALRRLFTASSEVSSPVYWT